MRKKSVAIYLGSSLLIAGIAFVLFYLPLPYKTYAQGVIYVPQEAYIRAQTEGFVDKVYIENDTEIGVGDTILELDSPGLESRAEVLRAQLDEARFRYEASVNNRTESDILLQEYRYLEQEYWDVTNRLSNLIIKSPASGHFVFAYRNSEQGRFYNRGEIIGFLVDFETLPLAAMISEDDIDRVRSETHAVTLKLASQPNKEYPSKILRQVPSSHAPCPVMCLAQRGAA
ncbi:peptidase [Vibrio ishigakensis]|uniref:Peptidase n=1 Tax=Vibrio ishigakensis TaxID=1481914 RepID=A0A0B8PC53_9VIBR|nr:peptidase [Vibrio ishigakensis]